MGCCASKDAALQAVEWEGTFLICFSPAIKDDKDVVMTAIQNSEYGEPLQYASADLRGDKDFMLQAIQNSFGGAALRYASADLQGDKDFVMQAVEQNPHALVHASPAMKDDKDVVLRAVAADGWSLTHASERLRGDKEVVLQAIEKDYNAFRSASDDLRGDKDFVMQAVASNGYSLMYAEEPLRGDKEVVLQAISRNRWALEYAADSLKRNKQFALEAVRRGCPVGYLDEELQKDPDIRRAAEAEFYGLTSGTERITFEGFVAQKEGVPCYSSFPGAHAKEWNGLTRKAAAGSVSTACVFLTTKDAGLGRHSSPCLCHHIYGPVPAEKYLTVFDKKPNMADEEYEQKLADAKKDSEAMNLLFLERNAYKSESEWKKAYEEALAKAKKRAAENNYVAPWGCFWFALWKAKVEEARKLHQDLVAVYFPGKCGKGKLDWSELADKGKLEQALRDNGLGFSQRAEVAWLEHCGYPVREIDLTTFCQECGLDESTA